VQRNLRKITFLKVVASDVLIHTHTEATGDEIVRQNTAPQRALREIDEYETEPLLDALPVAQPWLSQEV